jgi:hypothetical protein
MENIKLRFDYKSQNKNGWPLMMITMDDVVIDRFEANDTNWQALIPVHAHGEHSLRIWHYGKNYITDQQPDKFFLLEKMWINDVDLKHHLSRLQQTAFIAPWDQEPPPAHSLYLGHEGYIELRFRSPVMAWIQELFGAAGNDTMHGQKTTREVLQSVKHYFDQLD